uniref:Uncharacterized protein n=1 Tax=Oryza rufipogon TaxID=4529 RepID=A0A0E0NXU2_ORYRU
MTQPPHQTKPLRDLDFRPSSSARRHRCRRSRHPHTRYPCWLAIDWQFAAILRGVVTAGSPDVVVGKETADQES